MVWGLGALGLAVLHGVAARHPHRRFVGITRDPLRNNGFPPNVRLGDVARLGVDDAPVLVCVADEEAEVLRQYLVAGQLDLGRAMVARNNRRLFHPAVLGDRLRHRTVLMVTNPVELMCARLAQTAGCRAVYGVGMQIDAERYRDVLRAGWGIGLGADELPVSGMHGLEAIPVLSAVPGLAARIAAPPWPVVCDRLHNAARTDRLNWLLQPQRLAAVLSRLRPEPDDDPYRRLAIAAQALAAAEFNGWHPPVHRAGGHMNALVDSWFTTERVRVSAACQWPPAGGAEVFLGGTLDLATGAFGLPDLNATELERVARQVESMRALTVAVEES
ncbi:MAG TPA: hypothetical protein VFV67_32120 [Actinophytocola sp.]|uniref:hypothetical protein n=1 Tax=Actinophytocola sp. TaxID=1872138 RepID=UPI002DBC17E4|nr:hypothetical protein [Actinophytocola sp.]HEU5475313.1 hypothetical protein [Actinophytocola sp.]